MQRYHGLPSLRACDSPADLHKKQPNDPITPDEEIGQNYLLSAGALAGHLEPAGTCNYFAYLVLVAHGLGIAAINTNARFSLTAESLRSMSLSVNAEIC